WGRRLREVRRARCVLALHLERREGLLDRRGGSSYTVLGGEQPASQRGVGPDGRVVEGPVDRDDQVRRRGAAGGYRPRRGSHGVGALGPESLVGEEGDH